MHAAVKSWQGDKMDDTIYKELAQKGELEQHIVRVENIYGCGTGFLYAVKGSAYVYIITVCHIILKPFVKKESTEHVHISYRGESKRYLVSQFEIGTLYEESQLTEAVLDALEDEGEYSERHKDIAVLRIKKQDFLQNGNEIPFMFRLSEEKITRNLRFAGFGFPDSKKIYEELFGYCLDWNSEDKMITCKANNISSQPFCEVMRGFSGTGLIAQYEDSPVFIGVVVCCSNNENHQQFRIVGSSEISEKLRKIGWETMEEYDTGEVPEGFYRGDMMEMQDAYLEDMDHPTSYIIRKEIREIDRQYSPQKIITDEKFYNIPICDRNRKSCSCYWCGRVWSLFAAKVLHGDVSKTYCLSQDGRRLQIEYICSEGDGRADLASVVGAAINSKALGEQIPGDCILIWQSRENPGVKRSFPKEKFKRIINNIASGQSDKYKSFSKDAAYDLLDGEMKKKDYGIIHVQSLLEKLDGCKSEKEMKEKMEEILNELWR